MLAGSREGKPVRGARRGSIAKSRLYASQFGDLPALNQWARGRPTRSQPCKLTASQLRIRFFAVSARVALQGGGCALRDASAGGGRVAYHLEERADVVDVRAAAAVGRPAVPPALAIGYAVRARRCPLPPLLSSRVLTSSLALESPTQGRSPSLSSAALPAGPDA